MPQPKALRHLTRTERKALDEFVAELRKRYPEELVLVRLFGSKVRGNFDEESDVDVLVVVQDDETAYHDDSSPWAILHRQLTDEYNRRFWYPIIELSADLELKYGANISPRIMPCWQYDFIKEGNMLLYRNMRRHGVNLWTKKENSRLSASASKQRTKILPKPVKN